MRLQRTAREASFSIAPASQFSAEEGRRCERICYFAVPKHLSIWSSFSDLRAGVDETTCHFCANGSFAGFLVLVGPATRRQNGDKDQLPRSALFLTLKPVVTTGSAQDSPRQPRFAGCHPTMHQKTSLQHEPCSSCTMEVESVHIDAK